MKGAVMNSDTQSIKSLLAEREIYLPLRLTDPDDLSVRWEIRSIVKNSDLFESLYSKYPLLRVSDLDTLYFYLLTRKIARMGELIQFIESDEADLLTGLIADASIVLRKTTRSAIAYINKHTGEIFADSQPDGELKYASVDFIIEYQNDVGWHVFEYLCRNSPRLIVSRYDEMRNVFAEHPQLFSLLFPPECPVLVYEPGLQKVLDIWRQEYREDSPFRQLIDRHIDELCIQAEIYFLMSPDILKTGPVIRAVSLFLDQIKSRRAAGFSEYAKEADKQLFAYLRITKYSHKFSIPAGDANLEHWKVIDPQTSRLDELTHRMISGDDGREYESFLGLLPQNQSAYTGFEGFPNRIPFLSDLEDVNTGNFLTILANHQVFDDYIKKVRQAVGFISRQTPFALNLLEEDAGMLIFLLSSFRKNMNARNRQKRESSCYSASEFCCGFTEKLLRSFYQYILQNDRSGQINMPSHFWIGLIQKESIPLAGSFTWEHRLGLVYFLSSKSYKSEYGAIEYGKDYRNRLAHWAPDMNPRLMTPDWFARLLWLFTDVLNSVYLYFGGKTGRGVQVK